MICGAAQQARWFREEPRFTYSHALLERVVHIAFPNSSVVEVAPLRGGLRNANFKIKLNCIPDSIVIRVYQHDFSLCKKEMDLMRLIGGSVPVPELIYAEPNGWDDFPPFTLLRHIEGISFHELKRSGDANAVAQAAHWVGETLAAIGRMTFSKSGWLAPGLSVVDPQFATANAVPSFIDECLESPNLRERVPSTVRKGISAFAWSMSPQLAELGPQTQLVHGDFGKRNVMVRQTEGRWKVAAILNWEIVLVDDFSVNPIYVRMLSFVGVLATSSLVLLGIAPSLYTILAVPVVPAPLRSCSLSSGQASFRNGVGCALFDSLCRDFRIYIWPERTGS